MCISFFMIGDASSPAKLVLAGNRDEFFDRESAALGPWGPSLPNVFAGKDLVRGGTWLGMSAGQGSAFKFAVVHNFRHHGPPLQHARSRGDLVLDFLKCPKTAAQWAADVEAKAEFYNGFTLILVDGAEAYFVTNRPIRKARLAPGLYGLCNASLDTPWPKLVVGKRKFARLLACEPLAKDARRLARAVIDSVLKDRTRFTDDLPGVLDAEKERRLSSIFVEPYTWDAVGLYGTRTHSVVVAGDSGFLFVEETLDPSKNTWTVREIERGRAKL
jgi:uncharacterized protein with NRDE domain